MESDREEKTDSPAVRSRPESFRRALRIFRYLAPYRARFAGGIVTLLISTCFGLGFPYLTGLLLDAATAKKSTGWSGNIDLIALVLLGTLAIQALFSFFSTYWFYGCGESAVVDLRKATFRRLIGLPMSFFAHHRVGELTSRLFGLAILMPAIVPPAVL